MKYASKIIVVGGNAAGPAAAAKAKRANPESEVIMFEQSGFISTGTCELPYLLSGVIEDYKKIVFYDELSFFNEKGVKVYVNHQVEDISRKEKTIFVRNLTDNNIYKFEYDKLILATGSSAVIPFDLSGGYTNVFSFKSILDVIKIKETMKNSRLKKVGIIGSGYIGLETAEAFKNLGFEVFIVDKEPQPFPSSGKEIRELVRNILTTNGIDFFQTNTLQFVKKDDKVKSVKINGKSIEVDLLVYAAGIRPNNHLALKCGLETGISGAIKVNKKLQTSDTSIYAAGDSIEVMNFITKRPDYIPLATIAHKTGHIAGENAAGGNSFFEPVVKNISVKIFNRFYASCGLTETEAMNNRYAYSVVSSSTVNLIKVMPGSENVYGKIVFEKNSNKVLGAEFFGGKEISGYSDMISLMIKNNIPVTNLGEMEFNYTPPLSPFINLLSILGRKSKEINRK
jgi:NADPH-dependent 2,4-dienoyl-CoA reductase/sulfur reductase-like enzyme